MKKYKLIAIDVDGTLVNKEKKILEETKEDIIKAYENGIIIVIATGRSLPAARQYFSQFNFNIPLILYNGAVIRMSEDESIILNKTHSTEKSKEIYKLITDNDATCCFWSEDKLYFNKENYYSEFYEKITTIKPNIIKNHSEVNFNNINKFIWFDKPEVLEKVKKDVLSNVSEINFFNSQKDFLEIVPLGISKGDTLDYLVKSLNIDQSEVIAIGDDENDLSMIRYAGLGVAMENAKESVKNEADYITLSNEKNGVGKVINKYLI